MPNPIKKSVGKLLKLERLKLEIKLKDMADILEVTSASVMYIEKKEDDSAFVKYLKYLKSQGVDLNEIF